MRGLCLILSFMMLMGCGGYQIKNLVKSDVDLVTDEFIAKTRASVQELVTKLYKRNPAELKKIPGMTIEGRLAQLRANRHELRFEELGNRQGIDAMNLAFDPDYGGDRVFALAVGLGGMLRQAYGYKPEMFMTDRLDSDVLLTSARNVEVLLWKLKNTRRADGSHFIITYEYAGEIDNLSFERLFGEIIVLQEMMAKIAGDSDDRVVTGAVHAVGRVFIPLPL